ncbi:hypothetical protein B0H17DRAFT_1215701 [Mycena rosella]|uniref:Uncharacterized protein n=1 Tax=Mycena rosella TaxID=1033263 RepID=A0AAD7CGW8_MYCRO|nr:hypothetical protein B0H17DRAFT_1215701 [Mycena rosella]
MRPPSPIGTTLDTVMDTIRSTIGAREPSEVRAAYAAAPPKLHGEIQVQVGVVSLSEDPSLTIAWQYRSPGEPHVDATDQLLVDALSAGMNPGRMNWPDSPLRVQVHPYSPYTTAADVGSMLALLASRLEQQWGGVMSPAVHDVVSINDVVSVNQYSIDGEMARRLINFSGLLQTLNSLTHPRIRHNYPSKTGNISWIQRAQGIELAFGASMGG